MRILPAWMIGRGERQWLQTFSGVRYYPVAPQVEEVHLVDIAHHLSMLCRYTGACKKFYCVAPETKILTHDFRWVEAGYIRPGQLLWGFDERSGGHRNLRKWRPSIANIYGRVIRDRVELQMDDKTILRCSVEHPLLCSTKVAGNTRWITAGEILQRQKNGWTSKNHPIPTPVFLPKFLHTWEENLSYESGWLAGMFDGEGSLCTASSRGLILTIAQNEGPILSAIESSLARFGADFGKSTTHGRCKQLTVRGGIVEQLKLLGTIRPRRLLPKVAERLVGKDLMRAGEFVKIISAKDIGPGEVVALETSTHTYITEGFGSHNSVAEHSVLVSEVGSPEYALERLLHDAPEFVLNDLNRPTKHTWWLWGYRRLEARNWRVIAEKFGLNENLQQSTKDADNAVLMAERKVLMLPLPGKPWLKDAPADVKIRCLPPEQAETEFLQRFYELTRERGA